MVLLVKWMRRETRKAADKRRRRRARKWEKGRKRLKEAERWETCEEKGGDRKEGRERAAGDCAA